MTDRNAVIIKLVATMAAVSLVVTYAKITLISIPVFTFVWLQMLFASAAMIANTFLIRKESLPKIIDYKVVYLIVGIGLLNYLIVRFLFIYSLELLPVTTHAYLINFVGIVTMLLSAVLLKEKPKKIQVLGALVAIFGLWVFFYEVKIDGETQGLISISIAVFCLALTNLLIRKLQLIRPKDFSHNQIATFSVLVGALPLVVSGALIDLPLPSISISNWMIILLNGLIANALVMTVFSQAMEHLKAFEASLIGMSALVFTALFAMPVLGDYLNGFEFVGIALMITGIIVVQNKQE